MKKVKSKDIGNLIKVYATLVNAEYEDYQMAINITKDGFKVEDASKAFEKLKEGLIKKYKNEKGDIDTDKVEDFNKEFEKLMESTHSIDFKTVIPKSVLKSIKLTGLGAKTLDDYQLIEE